MIQFSVQKVGKMYRCTQTEPGTKVERISWETSLEAGRRWFDKQMCTRLGAEYEILYLSGNGTKDVLFEAQHTKLGIRRIYQASLG